MNERIVARTALSLIAQSTPAQDVEADARRWRTLRDGSTDLMLCWFTSGMEVPCEVSDYDAAIDAEIAAEGQKP